MKSRFLVAAIVLLAAAAAARAQTAAIDAEQFHPPATSNGFLSVDGAFVAPHLGLSAGVSLSYAHDPLVLRQAGRVVTNGELIRNQLGMDVVASFAVINHLELGVDLPFVPLQTVNNSVARLPNLHSAALGDLRVDLKGLVWAPSAHGHRFGLSVIAGLTAPTGDSNSFLSQHAVGGRFRLVGEWRSQWARLALELGAVVQPRRDYYDLHVGSQLSYGVAAGVPLPRGFSIVAEIAGLLGVALPAGAILTRAESPAEVAAGVGWRARFGLELTVAGGAGLSRGYGTPDGRFIFAVRYTTPDRPRRRGTALDSDGDGVLDERDRCPSQPGPATNDGCPTGLDDSDKDGVSDDKDRCPNDPGPAANGGCPDRDGDGDGVPDRLDACPDKPGSSSNAGCPPSDSDGDGVSDADDRCPTKAGPKENQGCPDFDSDGDGIVDRLDKCPFDAEVFNGVDDDDGCPDQPAALAQFNGDRVTLFEPILFERDGTLVDKRSFKLLEVVAHILRLHPEILKLRVEGHTDNKGAALDLLELSRARAASVRRWLVDNGHLDGKRLVAEGFGAGKPVADNRDFVGRAKNRRIELVVVQKLDSGN